jgi:transcriptional regulator with XRE-family HTH domain
MDEVGNSFGPLIRFSTIRYKGVIMPVPDKAFSSRLLELLARKGLNKKELAQAIDKKPGTVTPYFKGRIPRADILKNIARVLDPGWGTGATVAYLISGHAHSVAHEDEQKRAENQTGAGGVQSGNLQGRKPEPDTSGVDIDGQIADYLALSQEVLAELIQKKHGKEQPRAGDHFAPYLEQAPFFVFDQMAVVRYASSSACRLAGTTPEAAVGHSTVRNLAPEDSTRLILEQVEAMSTRGYWAGEVTMLTSQLERIKCVQFQFLVRDESGTPCMGNLLVPLRDLEDRRRDLRIDTEEVMRHTKWETELAEGSHGR